MPPSSILAPGRPDTEWLPIATSTRGWARWQTLTPIAAPSWVSESVRRHRMRSWNGCPSSGRGTKL